MSALSGKMGAVYKSYTGTDKSKEIANFQSGETWTVVAGGVIADDVDNFRLGTKSIKVSDLDDTASSPAILLESISLDLTLFEDGITASDTGDYIFVAFFVSGVAYTTSVSISLSTEPTFDLANRFVYSITNLVEGWNYVKIKKSAFTEAGVTSTEWNDIESIRVNISSANGSDTAGAYVSFQSLYLLDDSKTYDFALIDNTAYTLECMTLIYNWTVDAQTDVADVTSFLCDGVQFKEFIALLNSFTVSSEAFWGNGDFLDNLTSNFILSLYIDTLNGYRYDGLAKMTSDGISTDVADVVNEAIEFQGDGDLKYVDVQIIDS